MVQIKIKTTVISAQYGAMTRGDLLRCSAEYARHLVEELNAAEYLEAPAIPAVNPKTPRKKPKAQE